ncbi:hypothetical protein BaRGS_00025457, partial [Batillaria attramentaria]
SIRQVVACSAHLLSGAAGTAHLLEALERDGAVRLDVDLCSVVVETAGFRCGDQSYHLHCVCTPVPAALLNHRVTPFNHRLHPQESRCVVSGTSQHLEAMSLFCRGTDLMCLDDTTISGPWKRQVRRLETG